MKYSVIWYAILRCLPSWFWILPTNSAKFLDLSISWEAMLFVEYDMDLRCLLKSMPYLVEAYDSWFLTIVLSFTSDEYAMHQCVTT